MFPLKNFLLLGALLTVPVGIVSAQEPHAPHPKPEPTESCVATARWVDPASGRILETKRLIGQLSRRPVVLLGETHTSAEHHRWQLQTISALFGRNPNMVIGFEAFPRAVQPVLDRWSRGELSKAEFLEQSRWRDVWRFSPDLYMDLFDFVRMNRIPMRALNVEASLPRRIGEKGRAAIPEDQMEGVGTPSPASADYRKILRQIFDLHYDQGDKKRNFDNFVAAQQTWDRAMAEALADVRQGGGEPLVIGIVGSGHLEYGYGISAQLADLGVGNAAVLLPWDRDAPCQYLKSDSGAAVADAVFGVDAPDTSASTGKPKLGVMIEDSSRDGRKGVDKGVGISRVVEGSVADAAGLKAGDMIIGGAGKDLSKASALVALIRRQPPGTWLPLRVLRDGAEIDIIAKFPARRP